MYDTVDGNPALKANPHSAERAAWVPGDRAPKPILAGKHDRRRDSRAIVNRNAFVIYG